jgi:hypothetical protein
MTNEDLAELATWLRDEAPRQYPSMPTRLLRWADEVEAASRPQGDVVEAVAKAIYEQWVAAPGYVAWVDGGNSINQDEARRIASEALAGRLAAPPSIPDGYVVAPVMPTAAMIAAGVTHVTRVSDVDPDDERAVRDEIYTARGCVMAAYMDMLAAAPQPQPAGVPAEAPQYSLTDVDEAAGFCGVSAARRDLLRDALRAMPAGVPQLPTRKGSNDYGGYPPPEHGNAAEYWAEGYNDALDDIRAMLAASPSAPASQPAEAPQDEKLAKQLLTMRISYERAGRCFWHLDCKAQRHTPPMQIERDDTAIKQTLLRCTACNLAGWYPHGSVGEVCCAPEPLPAAPSPETKE